MELALGTVQFGLAYGAVGSGQQVSPATAAAILDAAWQQGVRLLDTAAAYGDIEERLADLCGSHAFRIVSKIRPLGALTDPQARMAALRDSLKTSQARLGERLHALMFHSAADLLSSDGPRLWDEARALLKGHELLLGVSCYAPQELLELRERLDIEIAQLPANALDQRLHHALTPPGAASRLEGVELHVRSAFLQGLLLAPQRGIQRVPAAATALQQWQHLCESERLAPKTAALAAVKALPQVRACVVGVETTAQWDEVHAAWREARAQFWPQLACADLAVIDPRTWPKP